MAIQELTPISCVIDEETFLDLPTTDEVDAYLVQYIRCADGKYLMRRRVAGGKVMVLPVAKLPGSAPVAQNVVVLEPATRKARRTMMSVNTDILPSGKIPGIILNQIISFFSSVMDNKIKDVVKGAQTISSAQYRHEYEAMAHVIWNRNTKEYRVGIPTQKVGKASVSYEHDDYSAADGDMVIVDIHSHNTMGAFFSGTDNRDDTSLYGYSGVVGNLDKPSPSVIFRLNAGELKVDKIPPEDIFDFSSPKPEVPAAWLDKVSVETFTYSGGLYSGGMYGARSKANRAFGFGRDDDEDWGIRHFGSPKGASGKNLAGLTQGRSPAARTRAT